MREATVKEYSTVRQEGAREVKRAVAYRELGEVGKLVRGNGMPKSDFVESGIGCIHYGQIYTYYGTWTTSTISFVSKEKARKLAKVDKGDLIVTNTIENLEKLPCASFKGR